MTKYIVLDCEMGGIDSNTSLLTAYFQIAVNDKRNPVPGNLMILPNYLDLHIKHDVYNVTAQGLEVNQINLVQHDNVAEYQKVAGQKLFRFLQKESDDGKNKLIPLGQGIAGDLMIIDQQLLGRKTWEQFCSYRRIDTGVIARFMQDLDLLPSDLSCGLESLIKHFQIDYLSTYTSKPLHTAEADALATWLVYKKEYEAMTGRIPTEIKLERPSDYYGDFRDHLPEPEMINLNDPIRGRLNELPCSYPGCKGHRNQPSANVTLPDSQPVLD